MIENLLYSVQKYFQDNGISVAIDNSDGKLEDDFITLSSITPELITVGDEYKKRIITLLIYLYDNNKHNFWRKVDQYLTIKSAGEQSFQVYDFSSGTANFNYDCTISMPDNAVFKTPFGNSMVDTIIITIRRKQ